MPAIRLLRRHAIVAAAGSNDAEAIAEVAAATSRSVGNDRA